jgi:sodium/bile acid cotransporter 7
MTLKSSFLPLGLLIAIAVALTSPALGLFIQEQQLSPILVAVIFLINGYQTKLEKKSFDINLSKGISIALFIALIISPFLGLGITKLLPLGSAFAVGLLIMSAMPSTLSSGIVISEQAGGDRLWAVLLTMILNLLGIFSIPFMLSFTLNDHPDFDISPFPLLLKLFQLVLVPFAIGFICKPLPTPNILKHRLGYLSSTCVIVIALGGLSSARELLMSMTLYALVLAAFASLSLHFLLMGMLYLSGTYFGFQKSKIISLCFVASQKTLPVAMSVLTALNADLGGALLLCLIFHFSQLMVDSYLAQLWSDKSQKESALN